MQGGVFTISNGGVYGSLLSTPILNPPQSGILGMHNIQQRPVAVDGEVVIRPMMYLALSYDHRIVDGKEASLDEAIEKAAELLHAADLPLVYGISNTTCEAQKECVAMADRLGGICDSHTSL